MITNFESIPEMNSISWMQTNMISKVCISILNKSNLMQFLLYRQLHVQKKKEKTKRDDKELHINAKHNFRLLLR